MFDLRTTLLAELNTFSITNVDTNKDMEATAIAIADTERVVFDAGAIVLGNWDIVDREPLFHNTNIVTNEIELIVMAKSKVALLGIDTMATDLSFQLDNNRMDRTDIMTAKVIDTAETVKLKPHFYYKILTFEVRATELAGSHSCPVPGVASWVSPVASTSIDGTADFTFSGLMATGTVFTPSTVIWTFEDVLGEVGFKLDSSPTVASTTLTAKITTDMNMTSGQTFDVIFYYLDATNSKYVVSATRNFTVA